MKTGKIIVFVIILLFSIYKIIDSKNLKLKENVYVVSQSEVEKRESISQKEEINKDNQIKETLNTDSINKNKRSITIFISGEVKNPGVVTIDSDKRLSDAIENLGGTTENADLNKINLAMKLEDEQHYIIPKIGEEIEYNLGQNTENNESGDSVEKSKLVNINLATIQELDTLPGVGEATANKIVNYREENGRFKSIDEIKNVNGIGEKKYEELKTMISIE